MRIGGLYEALGNHWFRRIPTRRRLHKDLTCIEGSADSISRLYELSLQAAADTLVHLCQFYAAEGCVRPG